MKANLQTPAYISDENKKTFRIWVQIFLIYIFFILSSFTWKNATKCCE